MNRPPLKIDFPVGEISHSGDFIIWTIPHFFSLPQVEKFLTISSPIFDFVRDYWQFKVHFDRASVSVSQKMIVELNPWTSCTCLFRIRMGVRGEKGQEVERQWHKFLFCDENPNPTLEFNSNEFMSRNCEVTPHCQLTIFCCIYEDLSLFKQPFTPGRPQFETIHRRGIVEEEAPKNESVGQLQADLKGLLLSGKDTDVVLKVGGKEFRAHKLILGMRSPVFLAMFEHDLAEKQSGIVTIEDGDPDTFPDFLHYIYAGKVENFTSENAIQLYRAADVYQLLPLKKECVDYMKKNLSVENFCDMYSLSVLHGEMELTRVAIQFFLEQGREIFKTAKWDAFKSENFLAANELFTRLLDPRRMYDIQKDVKNCLSYFERFANEHGTSEEKTPDTDEDN